MSIMEDWDNVSWKVEMGSGLYGKEGEKIKTQSGYECWSACKKDQQCMQFLLDGEYCYLGKAIRLGVKRLPENGKKWRSGWHHERIQEWIAKQGACTNVQFPNWRERIG
jgi:hypothetical protein